MKTRSPTLAISLAGILGILSAPVAVAQFTSTNFPVGPAPSGVAAADLDADGDVDLSHAHPSVDAVTASLNNGTATAFATGPLFGYPAGSRPRELVIGNFDGLGRPDYAVMLEGALGVSVHLAAGAWPGFGAATLVPTLGVPLEAVILDVEVDGDLDVAVLCINPSNVTILRNNGAGVFTPFSIPLPAAFAPHSITAGNFNGGGPADLVVTGSAGVAQALVLVNQSTFATVAFAAPQAFFSDLRPFGVCSGDFNGDGLDDIGIDGAAFAIVTVLLNAGPGGGGLIVNFASTSYPLPPGSIAGPNTEIECGDFNCDGLPDLAVCCQAIGRVAYMQNNGTGVFLPPVFVPAPASPADIVAAELDGAPGLDLATANDVSNDMTVLANAMVPGCCEHRFIGGIADGFGAALPVGAEDACPGAALLAAFGTIPRRDFDGPVATSRLFLHTFENLPRGIKRAVLRMRVRADGLSSAGDVFGTGFDPGTGSFQFTDTLGDLTGSLFPFGSTAGFSLDLSALPGGVNLLPKMNVDGRLDLFIRSNTAVDVALLEIESCARTEVGMNLNVDPIVWAFVNTNWSVSGAPPSGIVIYFIDTMVGPGPMTGFGQFCLPMPNVLGFAPSDAFGNSTFSLTFPTFPFPPCIELSSQAVGLGGGLVEFSNTYTQNFFD